MLLLLEIREGNLIKRGSSGVDRRNEEVEEEEETLIGNSIGDLGAAFFLPSKTFDLDDADTKEAAEPKEEEEEEEEEDEKEEDEIEEKSPCSLLLRCTFPCIS